MQSRTTCDMQPVLSFGSAIRWVLSCCIITPLFLCGVLVCVCLCARVCVCRQSSPVWGPDHTRHQLLHSICTVFMCILFFFLLWGLQEVFKSQYALMIVSNILPKLYIIHPVWLFKTRRIELGICHNFNCCTRAKKSLTGYCVCVCVHSAIQQEDA